MNQQKVGSFLKKLRIEKSITQAELAERLGVSNRSVSRWENGSTMPDFDLLMEMAQYYGVEVGEILSGERRPSEETEKSEELMLRIAEYNNIEKDFFSKRMSAKFLIAIVGMIVYKIVGDLGLSRIQPYNLIVSAVFGFSWGTLIAGFLYSSRYIMSAE